MSWDYRLVHRIETDGETYAVHEVYYNDAGQPNGVTERPCYLAAESVKELRSDLMLMRHAFELPILEWEDLPRRRDEGGAIGRRRVDSRR